MDKNQYEMLGTSNMILSTGEIFNLNNQRSILGSLCMNIESEKVTFKYS